LAAKAFRDDDARKKLNGIVHPLVGRRRSEIIASVAEDSVVVEDIPLLVESGMAPMFPLVVVVHADAEVRVQRLVDQRGMSEEDARARIAAQADDEQRRAVADIWLDNSGSPDELEKRARDVWDNRILPFAHNLSGRQIARVPARLVPADPSWPDQARRIVARLKTACGHRAIRVDHIGSTAVPDFDAKDVIDMQITVESLAVADELAEPLLAAGYPRWEHITEDVAKADARSTVDRYDHSDDVALWQKRIHASAAPGRPTNVPIRVRPTARSAPTTWPSSARPSGAPPVTSPRTPTPRSRGFSTPTGGPGSGPTQPDGSPSRSGVAPHCSAPLLGSVFPGVGRTN
jgi:dephospho-CoA kinase